MNQLLNGLVDATNFTTTENGAVTHKTTKSAILDMFGMCGAYRSRSDEDCILAFKKAFNENADLAMKCLFYLRDIRGGQGERRFFRVCFKWLADAQPETARKNLVNISEYGRWDDLIYTCLGTKLEKDMIAIVKGQLFLDLNSKTPSLLAKWLPSENASSPKTKAAAGVIREGLELSHKKYRQALSLLRTKINIVEKLMSEGRWDEIEFDKIPSVAGIKYKNAFARRDMIAKKYEAFAKNADTKVNADALYPYDVAHQAFHTHSDDSTGRAMVQKYWDNLPNYYGENSENGIAVVDVSGSMWGRPLEAAVSLGAYIAEKAHGPFANHFLTFSSHPELVKFEGTDIVDKFNRCSHADWGMNTDLKALFDLLLSTAIKNKVPQSEMPDKLYILSDMEFDGCLTPGWGRIDALEVDTLLEGIEKEWNRHGYELPRTIFWNLDARHENVPALDGRFSYVSGLSPVILETILSGKDGYDLMLEKLLSDRYLAIVA